MSSEEDDLPVLTQILRTGSGPIPPFSTDAAVSRESTDSHRTASRSADGEPSWPRALVIGSDPEPLDDGAAFEPDDRWSAHALTALLADDADATPGHNESASATVADPRRIDLRANDVFLRTAPTDIAFADRIDEPPMRVEPAGDGGDGGDPASATIASRDVPLIFRDPFWTPARDQDATLALRVRDSVLQELSGRIDTELDARIAQTLHAELETALAQLQMRLRVDLAEALRDVVGHAVDDAIRRLRDLSHPDDLL